MPKFTRRPTEYSYVQHAGTVEELASALSSYEGPPVAVVGRVVGENYPSETAMVQSTFGGDLVIAWQGNWIGGPVGSGIGGGLEVLQPDNLQALYEPVEG